MLVIKIRKRAKFINLNRCSDKLNIFVCVFHLKLHFLRDYIIPILITYRFHKNGQFITICDGQENNLDSYSVSCQ